MKQKHLLAAAITAILLFGTFVFACGDTNASNGDGSKKSSGTTARPFHNGDLIFQASQSEQSLAVSYATHSKYTHCGLLFNDGGNWFVYEAIGPVKKTAFKEWIAMGDSSYYVVRRLAKADSILDETTVSKMRASVNKRMGIGYDFYFGWNDSLVYCSELVWKAYNESTGLEIGAPRPLKEFDLSHPVVIATMKKRYGEQIPYEEKMISPGDVFDSPLLVTVAEGTR